MEENKCKYCTDDCGNTCRPIARSSEIISISYLIVAGIGALCGILIFLK